MVEPRAPARSLERDFNLPVPSTGCPKFVKGSDDRREHPREGRVLIDLATMPPEGPSGGFFDEDGYAPW